MLALSRTRKKRSRNESIPAWNKPLIRQRFLYNYKFCTTGFTALRPMCHSCEESDRFGLHTRSGSAVRLTMSNGLDRRTKLDRFGHKEYLVSNQLRPWARVKDMLRLTQLSISLTGCEACLRLSNRARNGSNIWSQQIFWAWNSVAWQGFWATSKGI